MFFRCFSTHPNGNETALKILQINCVYDTGSTGKLVRLLHERLKAEGMESTVIYGRGAVVREDGVVKVCRELFGKANNFFSRMTGLMYGGCLLSTARIKRIIQQEKPDLVHIHCINGYFVNIYSLMRWLREKNYPVVLTLHAEFMYTANCSHAFECDKWLVGCGQCGDIRAATKSWFFDRTAESFERMRQAFAGFSDRLAAVSVSPWQFSRAERAPILSGVRHVVIGNGVDTQVFYPREGGSACKAELGISEENKVVFHATAHFDPTPGHAKGGSYVLELAERLKNDPVIFVVAGRGGEGVKAPRNVIFLGHVGDQEKLAEYYSMADLTLITSRRETYGMPCAESLCCGTPVVGFQAGGPETIALADYSMFTEFGDVDQLESRIRQYIRSPAKRERIASEAEKCYATKRMTEQYLDLYRSMICG